jgi:3-deoxy-7-phosphoheptulonate synthase
MMNKINLNMKMNLELPTPEELKTEFPLAFEQQSFIENSRKQVIDILNQSDPRLLLIVGPCSIHDVPSAMEYASKLKQLANLVSDSFFIVMRVYFEKSRTSYGWKGIMYDPYLDGTQEIAAGLKLTRQLLVDLAKMGIPTATEFLDPASGQYFGDLISWGSIGARTSESQTHRQLASGLPMPVAFKNSTSGSIDVAINGVISSSMPHSFMGINDAGRISVHHTQGNPNVHIALRGGEKKTNYDPASIAGALTSLIKAGQPPRVIIDCSHDNSNRQHEQQPLVFKSVVHQILEGEKNIRGMILESHLFEGNQSFSKNLGMLKYAVSLTDPCLNWPETEKLILWGRQVLSLNHKQPHLENQYAVR